MEAGRALANTTASLPNAVALGNEKENDSPRTGNQVNGTSAAQAEPLQHTNRLERNIIARPYPTDAILLNDKWSNTFVSKSRTTSIFNAIAQFDPTKKSFEAREDLTQDGSC